MNPKTLNLVAAGGLVLLLLTAGFGLYGRGKQAARAETAEAGLIALQQAYKRITTDYARSLAADSAAEVTRLATRAPVEPAVTRYITLRDTIAYTDTLLVEAADAAVTTCSLALFACEARISTSDSVRANLEARIANLEAQVAATRSIAEAACSGKVPSWTLPVAGLLGAGLGAWVRGE